MSKNEHPIINLETFNTLSTILGDELNDLINDFIIYATSTITELNSAVLAADFDKIISIVHGQAGSSANIGLDQFSNTCQQICSHAKNKEIEQCTKLTEELKKQFETCKLSLKNKMS